MRQGNECQPDVTAIPAALRLLAMVLVVLGMAACTGAGAQKTPQGPSRVAFDHYRNARYGYQLDYPADFNAERVASNADGRVIRSDTVTLRVFGVQSRGQSLRALAVSEIADPSAASEIQNSAGSVVLVQADAGHRRTVKTIALSGERTGVLVIDAAPAQATQRRRVLDSFRPVSRAAADPAETDARRRYRNPALGFSIARPEGARVSRDGDNSVSFVVLGPANEAASEISDGFTLTIARDTHSNAPSLDAYAAAVRSDGASSPDRVRVGGQAARRYTSESAFGDTVTHWLFMPAGDARYHVSATVSGPARNYREQIDAMLASLRFDPAR